MTLQEKFKELDVTGSALLAANFYNFETVSGVLRAASARQMPVILQASPATIDYLGVEITVQLARAALRRYQVEGWLHLDHAESPDLIRTCLEAGFDSVMIDASEKPFEENIALTSQIVDMAGPFGASVEAELGYVAKLGQSHEKEGFTKPAEAREFVERTGVDALAVAIGSAHGFYKKTPRLDLDLLRQIGQEAGCALVLHGGSGIPAEQLREGIRRGIRKINVATEIKDLFMKLLQGELKDSTEIDLRKVFPPAIDGVEKLVREKLSIISEVTKTNGSGPQSPSV